MSSSRRSLRFHVHGATNTELFDLATSRAIVEAVLGRAAPCTPWTLDAIRPGYQAILCREMIAHRAPTLFERAFRVPPDVVVVEQRASWDDGCMRVKSSFALGGLDVVVDATFGAGDVRVEWTVDAARGAWGWRRARVERAVRDRVREFAGHVGDAGPSPHKNEMSK